MVESCNESGEEGVRFAMVGKARSSLDLTTNRNIGGILESDFQIRSKSGMVHLGGNWNFSPKIVQNRRQSSPLIFILSRFRDDELWRLIGYGVEVIGVDSTFIVDRNSDTNRG